MGEMPARPGVSDDLGRFNLLATLRHVLLVMKAKLAIWPQVITICGQMKAVAIPRFLALVFLVGMLNCGLEGVAEEPSNNGEDFIRPQARLSIGRWVENQHPARRSFSA
jgi:hypothetical protein